MSKIKATFVFIPIIKTYIRKALESLYENTPIEFRVVVVDQTLDGIYDEVKDLADLYLRSKRTNLGFSKAMNEGIIHGLNWGSEYVAACNDDILVLSPLWWQGIMDQFKEYPSMMAVNPASIIEPGFGYGLGQPNFKCPDWGVVVGNNIYPKKEDGTAFTLEEAKTKEGYDWLLNNYKKGHIEGFAGWFVIGKREMWENVGLYDERFYPGNGEDYDMNHRIYLASGRCSATMRSWIHHYWFSSKHSEENLPSLSRPAFQDVDSLFIHDKKGATSPIYPPRENEPFGNKRIRKSNGVFIDDIR